MKKLLLVAYESRFARCGGITAVMNHLPGYLRTAAGVATSVITPFHHKIAATAELPVRRIGEIEVPFFEDRVPVKVYCYEDRWHWYFLDARDYLLPHARRMTPTDEKFFAGSRHPYDVGTNANEQWRILRRDSLFFGAAVARALEVLGDTLDWTLVMQDWQAATTALALAGLKRNRDVKLFLTLHNSYDSGFVESEDLRGVGIDPDQVPPPSVYSAEERREVSISTVLGRVMPLLNMPVFTVSEQFARDFTEDDFQAKVMADHLQQLLKGPNLVGINNGPFTALAVPEKPELSDAQRRKYEPLNAWKAEQKAKAMTALAQFVPDEPERPVWGSISDFVAKAQASPELPWFILAGRDDTRQKGYEVATHSIRSFLGKPDHCNRAQFLFFPIPGDEGREGLVFLKELANDYPANVIALPFLFQEGYLSALQGAAFGIMPSLYEPFGMANEFYLSGAVGIGRATGGLLQQIVPDRSAASYTPAVQRRSGVWYPPSVPATGLLYREPDDNPSVVSDWQAFNAVGYLDQPGRNRIADRSNYRLFIGMAQALEQAIADAIEIYRKPAASDDTQPYYAMLVEGIKHIQRSFSWEWTAAEYNTYLV
jgi:glycogen synthase